jgi:ribonuclease P protein component
MSGPFTLGKHERLKSKKDIDTLFLAGKAFFVFPYKIVYQLKSGLPESSPLQFGVTVPKRNFKRAVDRNNIKRLTRELYRIQKVQLKEHLMNQQLVLQVMFIYTHNAKLSHAELLLPIEEALKRLEKLSVSN